MEIAQYERDGLVLADLTWPEVNEIRDLVDLVLIPVGSHEQHGPNLALRMDTTGAFEFARRASARMAPRLLVAPALPIGVSLHHMPFPGTITLGPETFIQVLVEMMQSLHAHGFERFLIVNGHGGNVAAINIAAIRARSELEIPFVGACTYFSFFDQEAEQRGGSGLLNGHACEIETSIAMYMMPEIVRPDALEPGDLTELATGLHADLTRYDVSIPFTFDEYTLNGALGDATRATAAFGQELIETALDNFCTFIDRLLASPYAGDTSSEGVRR